MKPRAPGRAQPDHHRQVQVQPRVCERELRRRGHALPELVSFLARTCWCSTGAGAGINRRGRRDWSASSSRTWKGSRPFGEPEAVTHRAPSPAWPCFRARPSRGLFELRFETGDVYPPYPRCAPIRWATSAFYESLGRMPQGFRRAGISARTMNCPRAGTRPICTWRGIAWNGAICPRTRSGRWKRL